MTDERAEKPRMGGVGMTWRMVADALAERLLHASEPCTAHTEEPDVANCPFCKDADALAIYRERGGDVILPRIEGPTVSIEELSRRGR